MSCYNEIESELKKEILNESIIFNQFDYGFFLKSKIKNNISALNHLFDEREWDIDNRVLFLKEIDQRFPIDNFNLEDEIKILYKYEEEKKIENRIKSLKDRVNYVESNLADMISSSFNKLEDTINAIQGDIDYALSTGIDVSALQNRINELKNKLPDINSSYYTHGEFSNNTNGVFREYPDRILSNNVNYTHNLYYKHTLNFSSADINFKELRKCQLINNKRPVAQRIFSPLFYSNRLYISEDLNTITVFEYNNDITLNDVNLIFVEKEKIELKDTITYSGAIMAFKNDYFVIVPCKNSIKIINPNTNNIQFECKYKYNNISKMISCEVFNNVFEICYMYNDNYYIDVFTYDYLNEKFKSFTINADNNLIGTPQFVYLDVDDSLLIVYFKENYELVEYNLLTGASLTCKLKYLPLYDKAKESWVEPIFDNYYTGRLIYVSCNNTGGFTFVVLKDLLEPEGAPHIVNTKSCPIGTHDNNYNIKAISNLVIRNDNLYLTYMSNDKGNLGIFSTLFTPIKAEMYDGSHCNKEEKDLTLNRREIYFDDNEKVYIKNNYGSKKDERFYLVGMAGNHAIAYVKLKGDQADKYVIYVGR